LQTPETSKLLELFSTALDELPKIEDDDSSGLTLEEVSSTFSLLLDSTGFSELEDTSFFSELEDSSTFTELDDSALFTELDDSSTLAELDDLSPGSESLLLLDFADFSELEEALLLTELDDSLSLAELEDVPVVELDKVSSTLEEDSSAASTGELSFESSPPQALPSNAATTTILPRTNFFNIKTSLLNITYTPPQNNHPVTKHSV
jgi:hypothetical protein